MKYRKVQKFVVYCVNCIKNKTKPKNGINFHGLADGYLWSCYDCGESEKIIFTNPNKPKLSDQLETANQKVNLS